MFDELGEGVYRRRYDSLDENVGLVVGDDGALVIDTRSTRRQAEEVRREVGRVTPLPVRWVINTHWHFDHAFGNFVFSDADIWGHELCQIALSTRGEEMKAGAKAWFPVDVRSQIDDVEVLPPEHVFAERMSLDIGRRVDMRYHGFGHTDADIVVDIPDADVSFFGDLVEEGAPPSFGDSYPLVWPLTLRLASNELASTIVPGHGDVVSPLFVRSQHEELVAVAELATSLIAGEISLEEAVGTGPYGEEVMRGAMLRAQAVAS